MKRSSKIKIAGIVVAGIGVSVLARVADAWLFAGSGDSISGNVDMLVLIPCAFLIWAVIAKDRNRDTPIADAVVREQRLAFSPKPRHAQVIVFRDDKMAALIGADVSVDERVHAQLISPRFTAIDLAPGTHRIAVEFQGQRAERSLELHDGDSVALHLKMRMGMTTSTPTLEIVPVDAARKMIGDAPMALPEATTA